MAVNAAIIIAAVSLVGELVERITESDQAAKIITLLEAWLPTIIAEIEDLVPVVQGIIATLQGSAVLTDAQIATVDALNAKVDADFEAAAAAASK